MLTFALVVTTTVAVLFLTRVLIRTTFTSAVRLQDLLTLKRTSMVLIFCTMARNKYRLKNVNQKAKWRGLLNNKFLSWKMFSSKNKLWPNASKMRFKYVAQFSYHLIAGPVIHHNLWKYFDERSPLLSGDGSYDFIVSWLVFLHIPDKKSIFERCFHNLKPGGKM